MPGGHINDPSSGNTNLFTNSLASVSDPWRAFWADMVHFKCPRLASCIASGTTEIQGHCQARRSQDSVTDNRHKPWLGVCWKRTCLHQSLVVKSQQYIIELETRPGGSQCLVTSTALVEITPRADSCLVWRASCWVDPHFSSWGVSRRVAQMKSPGGSVLPGNMTNTAVYEFYGKKSS